MFDHIKAIWCKGDQKLYDYTVGWLASVVMRPFVKTGTAIVLLSQQGAGKSIILNKIGEIQGKHFKTCSIHDVLGSFNSHVLKDGLLLFLDETVARSASAMNKLKNIITSRLCDE